MNMTVVKITNPGIGRVLPFFQLINAAFTMLAFGEVSLLLRGGGYEVSTEADDDEKPQPPPPPPDTGGIVRGGFKRGASND